MFQRNRAVFLAQYRSCSGIVSPGPGVPEPDRWQKMNVRALGRVIRDADSNQNILGRALRVLHHHVEIAVFREHAGIDQLKFWAPFVTSAVLFYKLCVRKCGVRVLVEVLHVGVSGCAVEVEVALLDVLSVVSLVARQAKEPLLQDGITEIPHSHGKADVLMTVADAGDTVLIPAVRSGSGVIVGEVLPSVAMRAIVLANG